MEEEVEKGKVMCFNVQLVNESIKNPKCIFYILKLNSHLSVDFSVQTLFASLAYRLKN